MVQFRPIEAVRAFAATALEHGATRPSLGLVEWDVGAHCEDPVTVQVVGRGYSTRGFNVNPGTMSVITYGTEGRS